MNAMLKMRINKRIRLYKRITSDKEIPYIVKLWKEGLRGAMLPTDKIEIFYIIKSAV